MGRAGERERDLGRVIRKASVTHTGGEFHVMAGCKVLGLRREVRVKMTFGNQEPLGGSGSRPSRELAHKEGEGREKEDLEPGGEEEGEEAWRPKKQESALAPAQGEQSRSTTALSRQPLKE